MENRDKRPYKANRIKGFQPSTATPKPRAEGSSPSAPATPKALKQRGFKAFSLLF